MRQQLFRFYRHQSLSRPSNDYLGVTLISFLIVSTATVINTIESNAFRLKKSSLTSIVTPKCPSECSCIDHYVDCSNRRLINLPGNISSETKKLENAFSIFVKDWMKENKVTDYSNAYVLANGPWRALSEQDREYYKQEAKLRDSGAAARTLGMNVTSSKGTSSAVQQQREDIYDPDAHRKFIDEIVNKGSIEDLLKNDFYIMSFNVSVRTNQNVFIPIEVGIVKFSIKEGIKDSYHEFVDGGDIPLGYAAAARSHMDFHKIPLRDFSINPTPEESDVLNKSKKEEYLDNLKETIKKIDEFVKPDLMYDNKDESVDQERVGWRPVFSLADLDNSGLHQTSGCLERLALETDNRWFFHSFKVLDLSYLLFALFKRSSPDDSGLRPLAYCQSELSNTIYDYVWGTNCEFHDTTDTPHCALSRSARLAYVLLDILCPVYDTEFTPKHKHPPAPSSQNSGSDNW